MERSEIRGHLTYGKTYPGLRFAPSGLRDRHSREIDERAQRGRQLSPARIVQEKAGIGRTPIGKHTHQLSLRNQFLDLRLEHEGKTGAIQRRIDHQVLVVQRQRPLDVDIDLDAATLELPAIDGTTGEAVTDARQALQVMR